MRCGPLIFADILHSPFLDPCCCYSHRCSHWLAGRGCNPPCTLIRATEVAIHVYYLLPFSNNNLPTLLIHLFITPFSGSPEFPTMEKVKYVHSGLVVVQTYAATLLCSRVQTVCITVKPGFSLTRKSPEKKHPLLASKHC